MQPITWLEHTKNGIGIIEIIVALDVGVDEPLRETKKAIRDCLQEKNVIWMSDES
ncbi:MAG: hypothetical protein HQM09_23140 [Candidatus Riflebacteria bacterium]|nr:hypothetical protein [Candidatus Riflebacteria bacterium]